MSRCVDSHVECMCKIVTLVALSYGHTVLPNRVAYVLEPAKGRYMPPVSEVTYSIANSLWVRTKVSGNEVSESVAKNREDNAEPPKKRTGATPNGQ